MDQVLIEMHQAHIVVPSRLRIYGALFAGMFCIALSAIFTRYAGVPGTVSAFYRVAIAVAILTMPFLRSVRGQRRVPSRRAGWLALGAGVFFSLDLGLWNTSLFLTPVATSTLLCNDAPIVVGLVSLVFFRERLGRQYWLGLAVAIAGMVIIAGRDMLAHSTLGTGDILAILAGVAYAGYLLTIGRIRSHVDTLASLFIPGLSATVVLAGYDIATHQTLWGFAGHQWLALLALGLISQVGGWYSINYALGHMPTSIVSVTLLGQPVMTALLAVPLLSAPLTSGQIVGGIVTLGGVYLVNQGIARKH